MAGTAPPTEKAPFFYAFAAFCFSVSIACLTPGRIAQFFGSVVASGVILAGIGYFVSMLFDGPLYTGRRSDESLVNSILFLGVFGLPSATYLWHAQFGLKKTSPNEPTNEGGGNDV